MRRNSYYETQAIPPQLSKNVGDLIYRYETKNGPHLQEILSSPHLQRELELYYGYNRSDINNELMRIKLQQQQQQQQHHHNESLTSLTDSECFNDDQDHEDLVSTEKVANNLTRLGRFLDFLSRLPLPLSFTGMGICFLFAVFICPRACCENILFPVFRLAFGTLYPAYASYKAVRTKNVKEYVKWMMYWIVYAFFTCIETFTDIFLAWFPFYYEFKVIIVLWLLSPATKGSSTLYRKFVHPMLTRREQEIDEYLNQAKERGYSAVLQFGSKGVNYATNVIMQTALKGGGNLVQTIRRSYSLSDLSEPDVHRTQDEIDEVVRPQRLQRPRSQTVRSSSGGRQTNMYFPEVDVEPKVPPVNYNYIRSSEDISSGYSSAEPISGGLSRTSSMTNTTRPRFKAKRAEDTEDYHVGEINQSPLRAPDFINPLHSPSNPRNLNQLPTYKPIDVLENWKDEAFFSNQQYYQKREEGSLSNDGGGGDGSYYGIDTRNMSPDKFEKYLLFCKWLENNEETKNCDEKVNQGLEKEANNTEISKRQEDQVPKFSESIKSAQKQISEDEFKDTVSTASGDDEFVDVIPETKDNVVSNNSKNTPQKAQTIEVSSLTSTSANMETNSQKPDAFAHVVILDSDDSHPNESATKSEEIQSKSIELPILDASDAKKQIDDLPPKDIEAEKDISMESQIIHSKSNTPKLESLLEDIQKQVQSTLSEFKTTSTPEVTASNLKQELDNSKNSALDEISSEMVSDLLKCRASHGKGKAPEPPPKLSPQQTASEEQSRLEYQNRPTILSYDSVPSLKTLDPSKQLHNIVDPVPRSHSRSPSPKPEGKKSKKGLLKSYLPSLFRSESPKPTQKNSDDYHKETQI